MTRAWWPFNDEPAPAPRPDDRVELTDAGMNVLMRSRIDQVDAIVDDALRKYTGRRAAPLDVLLDVRLALHPERSRSAVPVVPGPDGCA